MISFGGLARASTRLAPFWALALLAIFAFNIAVNVHAGIFAADFRGTIWQAGRDILHGHSPYPAPDAAALARAGNPSVYPASTLVLAAPLGLLPLTVSAILWDILSVCALVAALRIVGVRDWRLFAVVLLSFPVAESLELAQFDAALALACALVWRWRNARALRLGIVLAAAVALKLLLWPLLVWTAARGRWRVAVGAAAGAVCLVLAGWAVIGFAGLTGYPRLLSALTNAFGEEGYSLMALATRLGFTPSAARWVPLLAAVALCALCVRFASKSRDADAFIAAIAAGIIGSPILWMHYAVILMVAMAVKKPTLSLAWAAPVVLWLTPTENPGGGTRFTLGFLLLLLLVASALVRGERARQLRMRWWPSPAGAQR